MLDCKNFLKHRRGRLSIRGSALTIRVERDAEMTKPPSSMEAPQPRCPEDALTRLPSHGYHNFYGSMNRTNSTVGPNENPSGARNNNTTTGARQSPSPRDDKSRESGGEVSLVALWLWHRETRARAVGR